MMSEKLFNNAYLHFFVKTKKTTFISVVVFLVVIFFIGHFMIGNSDTVWRRKAGAAHLQDLAAQYRANPTDHRPLQEISEIAQSSFFLTAVMRGVCWLISVSLTTLLSRLSAKGSET